MDIQIRVEETAGKAVVTAKGSLDWNASPDLKKAFDGLFKKSVYNVVFDGSGVTYISSSGFGVFVEALNVVQTAAGRLVFLNPSEPIREIFQLLGATHLLTTADSRDAALKLLG